MTDNSSFIPAQGGPTYYSGQPSLIFRYGEILLNYAEAAIELGNEGDALNAINQIRQRAGIIALTTIDRDKVRHERQVELAFENHRWWDIRRWRIASEILNNTQFHALWPWLNWQANTSPANMKYTFQIVPAPKNPRTFSPTLYYEGIPVSDANPKLIQNPGY